MVAFFVHFPAYRSIFERKVVEMVPILDDIHKQRSFETGQKLLGTRAGTIDSGCAKTFFITGANTFFSKNLGERRLFIEKKLRRGEMTFFRKGAKTFLSQNLKIQNQKVIYVGRVK